MGNFLTRNAVAGLVQQAPQTSLSASGRFMNIRSQYKPQVINDYVDVTNSPMVLSPSLQSGVIPSNFATGTTMPVGKQYNVNYLKKVDYHNDNAWGLIQPYPQLFGYKVPVNPRFAVGCNQPMLSPTIPQARFGYGKIMTTPMPIAVRTFKIPLISSVLGVLIPADQFLLIPLKTLYNMLLQVTLSPYAMFSTGYSDVHQFDKTGMAKQISRSYRVTQVQYNLHIYQWP